MNDATRRFLVAAVGTACARWREDDQGIWEMGGPPRPYLPASSCAWVVLVDYFADRGAYGVLIGNQPNLRTRLVGMPWHAPSAHKDSLD